MEKFKKEVLECYHGHETAKMLHSVKLLNQLSGKEVLTCRDYIQAWIDETEEDQLQVLTEKNRVLTEALVKITSFNEQIEDMMHENGSYDKELMESLSHAKELLK